MGFQKDKHQGGRTIAVEKLIRNTSDARWKNGGVKGDKSKRGVTVEETPKPRG